MKNIFIIIFGLLLSLNVFGTAQIPDILIYNNDTISLHANPLESFYNNETNPRPIDFGVSECWSTACWIGYQATWEIFDNKLYLKEIADCCFWENYLITDVVLAFLADRLSSELLEKIKSLKGIEYDSYDFEKNLRKKLGKKEYKKNKKVLFNASLKPRPKANLNHLFGELCKDGKVFAFWFTGDLSIPKGDLIEYVHMGYMSLYEKELVLTVEKGELIDAIEYENNLNGIKSGFSILQATSYSIFVPKEIIPNEEDYLYTLTDTIKFSNTSKTISLEALSKFNDVRKESSKRTILVEKTIDSLSMSLRKQYSFILKKTQKLRWGTACWIDGFDRIRNERLRIFTMSNINSQVTIYYKEQKITEKEFARKVDYIISTVELMEFGY